jgi:hypothetical protein
MATLVATGTTLDATAGKAFKPTVATFTSTDLTEKASNFLAMITWGDGTSSTGTVAAVKLHPGKFVVTGSHSYSANNFPELNAKVSIRERKGQAPTAAKALAAGAVSAAAATPPAGAASTYTAIALKGGNISNIVPVPVSVTEGQAFTDQIIGVFRDTVQHQLNVKIPGSTNTFPISVPATAYTVSVSLQVGNSSIQRDFNLTAKVVPDPQGHSLYDVVASGTLGQANDTGGTPIGTYLQVQASPPSLGVNSPPLSATSFITIRDQPLLDAVPQNSTGLDAGMDSNISVATFTDDNPFTSFGDYRISIDWGDGKSSTQTYNSNPDSIDLHLISSPSSFPISSPYTLYGIYAHHTYQAPGHYDITVTVGDTGQSQVVINSTADVIGGEHPTLQGVTPEAVEAGTAPPLPPASLPQLAFFSVNASHINEASLSDYTFTINWGDGKTTPAAFLDSSLTDTSGTIINDHVYAHGGEGDSPLYYGITIKVYGPGITVSNPLSISETIAVFPPHLFY